jgi:hypothetical protein
VLVVLLMMELVVAVVVEEEEEEGGGGSSCKAALTTISTAAIRQPTCGGGERVPIEKWWSSHNNGKEHGTLTQTLVHAQAADGDLELTMQQRIIIIVVFVEWDICHVVSNPIVDSKLMSFACGVVGCSFSCTSPFRLTQHTLEFDHRGLPSDANAPRELLCGVDACAKRYRSGAALREHRRTAHALDVERFGGFSRAQLGACVHAGDAGLRTLCLLGCCRGHVARDLNGMLGRVIREIDSLSPLLFRLAGTKRRRLSVLNRAGPQLRAINPSRLFREDHVATVGQFRGNVTRQILVALAEHDWPRPPPTDVARCCACLQTSDPHCMLRCGQPCSGDGDVVADTSRLRGPGETWCDERPLVYCGRAYHTYCLRATASLIDADLVQLAHVRMSQFFDSLRVPGAQDRDAYLPCKQITDGVWRCRECALIGLEPRPLNSADPTRLHVPPIDALHAVISRGDASPHAHLVFSTLLFHMASFQYNMTVSLQTISDHIITL